MKDWLLKYGVGGMTSILFMLCLGSVWVHSDTLPADVLVAEWHWLYLWGACCMAWLGVLMLFCPCRLESVFPVSVSWTLILWGGAEAVLGMLQVVGWIPSRHLQFALTGSFYNPGPYGGYLAMIFPLALHECLKRNSKDIPYYILVAIMFVMACVLPATRSRSAWVACLLSSSMVLGFHYWGCWKQWIKAKQRYAAWWGGVGVCLFGMAMMGMYGLKKDSADGRLFMWKIATQAVVEHPLSGCGWKKTMGAYGRTQEAYFAQADYTTTEEYVAGAPRQVFNEYLQMALAWGVPATCGWIVVCAVCGYVGYRRKEYGLLGAWVSLAIFAFSSYPFRFPAFVSAWMLLLLCCVLSCRLSKFIPVRMFLGISFAVGSVICASLANKEKENELAYEQWEANRAYYRFGAYKQAVECYADVYDKLKGDVGFLFEYGHALHKLGRLADSNKILARADSMSCDPMILNVMGKNYQQQKMYPEAESCFLRAVHRLPGRIYPYYLLALLYADSAYYHPQELQWAIRKVCTKEPKVHSTAVRQMRENVRQILNDKKF